QPHDGGRRYGRGVEGLMFDFAEHPGLLFVWATLLPLASFVILLLAGALRCALKPHKAENDLAGTLYEVLGGDVPGKGAAFVSIAGIGLACVLSVIGFVTLLTDPTLHEDHGSQPANHSHDHGKGEKEAQGKLDEHEHHKSVGALRAELAVLFHENSHEQPP